MAKRTATIRRVDKNQTEIVNALRGIGATVQPIHTVGRGCPDLIVGFKGENYLLEVKNGSKSKLTPDELEWHRLWNGSVFQVHDVTEAIYKVTMGFKPETGAEVAGL